MRHDLIEIGRGQIEVLVPLDAVNTIYLSVLCLVWPNQQAVDLPPVVGRDPGISNDRRVVVERLHLGQRLGDQVLVDDRNDWHLHPGHGSNLRGIATRRVDQVLTNNAALVGDDLPTAVR